MRDYFNNRIEQIEKAINKFTEAYRAKNEGKEPDPGTVKEHYERLMEAGKKSDILNAIDRIGAAARDAAGAISFLQAYTDPEDPDHPDIVGARRILTDIADKAQAAGGMLDNPPMNGTYYFFDCIDEIIGEELLTAEEVSTRLYGTDRGLTERELEEIAADHDAELHRYTYMDGTELEHRVLRYIFW